MSLDFVPRKVARPQSTTRATVTPTLYSERNADSCHTEGKGKDKNPSTAAEHHAALVHLSLSEYALWADSYLLRRVTDQKTEGFIPVSYLMRQSRYLFHVNPTPSEVVIIKAVRAHLNDVFETRILVSSPARWELHSHGSSSGFSRNEESLGGYEIRRRDWQDVAEKISRSNKRDWDARTIYVEKLSPQFRSIPAICRFIGLLSADSSAYLQVQSVTLPPHHLDKSDEQPKPKGFAFITLLSLSSAETILRDWPWVAQNGQSRDGSSIAVQEAVKYGFRTISKARWEELRDEYLAYREQLLEEMASSEADALDQTRPSIPTMALPETSSALSTRAQSRTNTSSSYPLGCLIFVRNVHPETNKTTLRTLFTSAIRKEKEVLDYVDFNKGMDSCFLRVTTSTYAQMLVGHFTVHAIVQSNGLDCSGSYDQPNSTSKAIVMELTRGKKEEIYWDKVPATVKKQAVQKASAGLADEDVVHTKRYRLS